MEEHRKFLDMEVTAQMRSWSCSTWVGGYKHLVKTTLSEERRRRKPILAVRWLSGSLLSWQYSCHYRSLVGHQSTKHSQVSSFENRMSALSLHIKFTNSIYRILPSPVADPGFLEGGLASEAIKD